MMKKMPSYDPDLIAALAEGSLDPEMAAAAERRIASNPSAAAELAAQRAALAAWRDAEPALLTAAESLRLRDAVAAALHLDSESAVLSIRRRRTPWTTIAVAAATVVAAAVLLPLALFSSDDARNLDSLAGETADYSSVSVREEAEDGGDLLGAMVPAADETAPQESGLSATTTEGWADAENSRLWSDLAARLYADPVVLFAKADPDLDTCRPEAVALLGEFSVSSAEILTASGMVIVWFTSVDDTEMDSLIIFDPTDCTVHAQHP